MGSFNVTVPIAVVITLWLAWQPDRSALTRWLWVMSISTALVIGSKLAFLGWGIGIRSIDFTGFSGHAMRSAAIFPVLFFLLVAWLHTGSRSLAAFFGLLLATLIAGSRIMVHAHSFSEALSGLLLGTMTSLVFLYHIRHRTELKIHPVLGVISLVSLLFPPQMTPVPTQSILIRTALFISGHQTPYIRATWRMAPLLPISGRHIRPPQAKAPQRS